MSTLIFARKNPVYFLCKTSGEFFYEAEGYVCLNNGLSVFLNNENFKDNVKDSIEFRIREYYKTRFEKK